MKIDVVTIFPDYLAPLSLSLVGKAIQTGIVELGVHDLRQWTHDRHRTVDDTPYGGGAGMVMRPEPWGEALDQLAEASSRLVVLTPSGLPFTQQLAADLAGEDHLILACGRYEGFDARVIADARQQMRVDEVSLGDYVLNGGEVAALAVVEAVVRLLPGVLGNPASLAEESYAPEHDGLLEYPSYTKPPSWRGHDVPEILTSGHHGQIAAWRREQALALTRERRPDLLPPQDRPILIRPATPADAGELLTVQRAAFVVEAQIMEAPHLPPLTQTLPELIESMTTETVLCAVQGERIVGAVQGHLEPDGAWYVGRLVVAPDLQGRGLGRRLLAEIEGSAPPGTTIFRLQTGARSSANLAFYGRHGYREVAQIEIVGVSAVVLERSVSDI